MAFDPKSLVQIASLPRGAGKVTTIWAYATADAAATVVAAGYFNADRNKLRVNDIVMVSCVADGTGVLVFAKLTAVPASGNVTCTSNTPTLS